MDQEQDLLNSDSSSDSQSLRDHLYPTIMIRNSSSQHSPPTNKYELHLQTNAVKSLLNIHQSNQIKKVNEQQQSNEPVPFSVFNDVVQKLEERINELVMRVENIEKSDPQQPNSLRSQRISARSDEHIKVHDNSDFNHRTPNQLSVMQDVSSQGNGKYQKTSPFQTKKLTVDAIQFNQSNISQPSPSNKRIVTPQKQEPLIQRLNLFERKHKNLEDKIKKFQKDYELFKLDEDRKIDRQLQKVNETLEKSKQLSFDLTMKIEELGSNQKAIVTHLHSIGQELSEQSALVKHIQEEPIQQIQQLAQRFREFEQEKQKDEEFLIDIKQFQGSIENDILVILKHYKEIINEVFKVQILADDVKSLFQLLHQME